MGGFTQDFTGERMKTDTEYEAEAKVNEELMKFVLGHPDKSLDRFYEAVAFYRHTVREAHRYSLAQTGLPALMRYLSYDEESR